MKRQPVPVVEINRAPFSGKASWYNIVPPTCADPAPTPDSFFPRKKQKTMLGLVPITKQAQLGIPISPTVSDFENMERTPLRGSGRLRLPTTLAADSDLTLGSFDHESRQPLQALATRVASGSNVAPDTMSREEESDVPTYEVVDDEILEDDNLIIPGETPLDLVDTVRSVKGQEDIPVRVLTDFAVYDFDTHELVPIAVLGELEFTIRKFGASGLTKPWLEGNEDGANEDSEDEVNGLGFERVKLSNILDFVIHGVSDTADTLDSKIYIRTQYAWYILDIPSDQYQPLFIPFWIRHRVLHLMVTVLIDKPHTSYEEFLGSLDTSLMDDAEPDVITASDDVLATLTMLGRALTESDVQSDEVKAYVLVSLPEICNRHYIRFKSQPLIQHYFNNSELDFCDDSYSPRKSKASRLNKPSLNKEREVLKHRNTTVVTPVVSSIARHLFKSSLEITGAAPNDMYLATEIDSVKAHHNDPSSMRWSHAPNENEIYSSVIMDGVEYYAGDDVMVNPGDDEDMRRSQNAKTAAAQSPNSYANRLWFCKICYFFEEYQDGKAVKMFHGQWYLPGSKTILQETAHSKSLYLLNECASNPIASIFKKCRITMIGSEDLEIPDDGNPEANDFHCGLTYNEKNSTFLDIPTPKDLERLLSVSLCLPCAKKQEETNMQQVRWGNGPYQEFSYQGSNFHRHDFIYIRPATLTGLLLIAQIVKIRKAESGMPRVTVRYFERAQLHHLDAQGAGLPSDERCLYATSRKEVLENFHLIDGICHVRQLTDLKDIHEWVKHDDHFYFNQEEWENNKHLHPMTTMLKICEHCYDARQQKLIRDNRLLARNGPISCLELFSGAGGLGTGLNMSGYVNTKYAVEFSPSAAATYQSNHPHATVYCQDSSLLLKYAIETEEGKKPKPLLSNDGKTLLPAMPKKGSIDMISGGPPCQSFSHANHNPRADDIRSTLPGNMLSYVEHYNPRYFLLENVAGLLSYRPLSTYGKNKRSLQGGIQAGMVKFIMRSLIALGYQVRCKVVQAGQYGAPQSRRRVIFWGAKRGVTIPEYPIPVYAWPKGMHRTNLPTGQSLFPVSRSRNPDDYHQCAPLLPITVNDAIGDLPPFDWVNPHDTIPVKERDRKEVKQRVVQGILQFPAVQGGHKNGALPGFPDGTNYLSAPMNRYQKWLRQEMKADEGVQHHYTRKFSSRLVEATTTVPLKPWANHRDLPLALQPNHAKPGAKQSAKSFYGRLDGSSQFKCAMTTAAPNTKESWLLHPSQKRIMSVRECARAQGFPDHYIFESVDSEPQKMVNNQVRQIGNAVPIPLAFHLGKSLGAALIKDWEREERDGSPAV